MTEERKQIFTKLQKHTWFKNTDQTIKDELANLAEDYDPFLTNLADRPDEIGELEVLKLNKVGYGHFLILLVFEVRSSITNQIFTFEYASWKTGKRPGARGILFLETNGRISHFIVGKSHKFSVAEEVYDSIGGLYLHIFENKIRNLPNKIEQEICFHLGVDKLVFKKVYNLGSAHPDYGMTNNTSDLFAAVVDVSNLPNLVTKDDFRLTHKPVGFELKIIPIVEFMKYINIIEDNYFLSAAARVLASKEIDLDI